MPLSPEFLDELRARTPLAGLVGRRVKLSKSGRNWRGCCPFHGEKTPSFYVYDDHFHCFGCGAHGDAIAFAMQSGGASFPEAVEALAGEAGLEVPAASPAQRQAERARADLHTVLERAQDYFVGQLRSAPGADARAYLGRRGLGEQTIGRFGLGWSGDGRGGLRQALAASGIDDAQAEQAGLLRVADDGSRRELFWGRVTFPIRDRRGRLVSFGGRTVADAKPKYINGPETPIFPKSRTLYALDLARDAVRAGQRLVVVEGYLDVIALHQAGFEGAVAPLGTALSADHLAELWRIDPAPTLCLDGDAAGARATLRTIELALPLLQPGQTLKVASLPDGQDPDSLVRAEPSRFAAALDAAAPLVDALFRALAQGVGPAPEQRAALRVRLDAAASSIADRTLAAEFRTALRDRFFQARRQPAQAAAPPARPQHSSAEIHLERARLLTAILLRHPALLRDVEEAYAGLRLPAELATLRDAILHVDDHALLDSDTLLSHLQHSGTAEQAALVLSAKPGPRSLRPKAMPAEAEAEWWSLFGLMHRDELERDVAAARSAAADQLDPASQQRLIALRNALDALSADSLE